MKTSTALLSVLITFGFSGCENDDNTFTPPIDGLSLYWDHEVFGDEGRRLRFEAFSTNEFDNRYELTFHTSVMDKTITVRLVESTDNGKCQFFPSPISSNNDLTRCPASGEFYLSDKTLESGVYSLKMIMPGFEVTSELNVTDEKVTLDIPGNNFLESAIQHVYPIPSNLLFGSVIYQGSNNTKDAENFLDYLTDLGLIQTTVPNHPYSHLTVDENGLQPVRHWEPDNHSIGFLFNMNDTDFHTIFEEAKEYFNQTNLNLYLYTSNGDQGFMNKTDGITVVYAKK